jgi:hypothetical protein
MLRFSPRAVAAACAAALVLAAVPASATITIKLNNTFIDKYANRATIDAGVTIDATAKTPHQAVQDGDMHAAGHSPDIGFATVVEIMNARDSDETAAVAKLKGAAGQTIAFNGYWRLWPEHGGNATFTQGGTFDPIVNTNPNHVFEIHPVLSIASIDVRNTLHPIEGYDAKDATRAFQAIDNEPCTIKPSAGGTTTLVTGMIGYNYIKFALRLIDDPSKTAKKLTDGYYLFADAYDQETHELLASHIRIVVAAKTPEAKAIAGHKKGDALVVLGVPRIDLSLVKYRATHPQAAEWNLPYEVIIAGIYDEAIELD